MATILTLPGVIGGVDLNNATDTTIITLPGVIGGIQGQAAGGTAAVTGTATGSITEADVVTGGKTIILTLTGDTFVAAGTGPIGSTADTQALIDGITSAQTETLGWNNEVRDTEVTTSVVRTSSTVATITLSASASYDITAQETITITIPGAVLVGAAAIVASPTFTVDPVSAGGSVPIFYHHLRQMMGQ